MGISPGGKASRWSSKRRSVILMNKANAAASNRLFAFGYADLADLLGVSIRTVRTAVSKGELDPTSFISIIEAFQKCRKKAP